MTESDLILLEEYLDGELSAADARALEERAVREPELAAELNRLKGDRQIRAKVWRMMEGDEAAVAAVANRVASSIQRRTSYAHLIRGLRIGFAAAACVVLGLGIGFVARSSNSGQSPVAVGPNQSGKIAFTGTLPSQEPGYNVQFKDQTGKVVAVQHFQSLDEARQFVQDVSQWQERQQQMHEGNIVNVADQQY